MSFNNPYKHPTFTCLKAKYQTLKAPHEATIKNFENAKEAAWVSSLEYKIVNRLRNLPKIPGLIMIWAGFPLVIQGLQDYRFMLIFIIMICYATTPWFANAASALLKNKVLRKNSHVLGELEASAIIASRQIYSIDNLYDAEWASACTIFNDYPPDWRQRCESVKYRDGNKCVSCGYPTGFKRKSRELHVHHVLPISEGGTNELDNLITLCHICHRNVDEKHHGVKRVNKPKPKHRRRRWY